VDEVFKALADPQRRLLLDRLNAHNGQTLRELCAGLGTTRQAVSKHLAVLEGAHLVTTVRRGREKWHYLNPAPITEIADRWIRHYDRARAHALADLKYALEETMGRPTFVHTSFIRTTPERLWAALTEPAFTRRYWRTSIETDWAPGSGMTWRMGAGDGEAVVADPGQIVLESDPPRRLSYAWHTFTPAWAAAVGIDEELRAKIAAERRSRVTFDLEPDGPLVKLTVVHDEFDEGSTVAEMVSGGWPKVVGEIKTLLEAGGSDAEGFGAQVAIAAPVEDVLAAVTTLDGVAGWWNPDVTGSPEPGGDLTFRFDGPAVVMHVEHVDPAGLVVWTCTASEVFDDWVGTSVWFDVRPRPGGGSVLAFRHVGLVPELECFGVCRPGWEQYLPSLAQFVQGDGGSPRGSADWVAQRAGAC
jgi:uncharacterized protein YndB with AHSA1/START domain/DNA-binding transcriptional ArsR family regulator